MIPRFLIPRVAAQLLLCFLSIFFGAIQIARAESQGIILGGEVGNAASACAARFRFAPFDSLPWLRADLTGEKVTEFDDRFGHVMRRPFKQYSGDISGRYLEIMAMDSQGDLNVHPALKTMLDEVVKHQRPGGYYCASGVIDWQQPIDYVNETSPGSGGRMLPALWGNSRMLCGLVEAMRAFPKHAGVASAARKLGDFYIAMLPRFNDPARIGEYTSAGSYAAGHVTCWFPAMEGLVKLGTFTGERKYIDAAKEMAAFYERFDRLPIDHAHGMLCCQVSLLLLFEATKDPVYLERVEKRWGELVTGGYINPAGGILEKCHVSYLKDEGCGIADWLRLNLALGQATGKPRYWAMAERAVHNHFLQNQNGKGGFGHRHMQTDEHGVCGFDHRLQESTWCCSFHGELGFIQLRRHLVSLTDGVLACRFAMDFSVADTAGKITSLLRNGVKPGEVMRQRISLAGRPAVRVMVRMPHWADKVTAVDTNGKPMPMESKDGWHSTAQPVNEVEFVYHGAVYTEDRHCVRLPNGPEAGKSFVLGYGPKLLAVAGLSAQAPAWPLTPEDFEAKGLKPLPAAFRDKDCRFVFSKEWRINTTEEWQSAAASSEELSFKDGMATPTAEKALFRSVVKRFQGKRTFDKITLSQSPVWQNWEPIAKVGPVNLEDAPVFLVRGPRDYWMFGLYRNGKGEVGKTGIIERPKDFKAVPAILNGFDVPLMTTPFTNQYDAPGGLKPGLGGYHAWQSKDMVHWVHHGPVTEKVSQWVTTAEQVDGKTYIYYDYPNDQDPHLFIDDNLTDGIPGKNMGLAFKNPTDGSDCTFIRDPEGKFHVIYEDWTPIDAKAHSWDSPLAGHAVSVDGIKDFKILPHAVDQRTKPTGRKGTYEHPHWMQHPEWNTNIGEYEIHEPEQNAFGDWAAISIGGQYYLFCDYHPAGEKIRIGWFTSGGIDKPFTYCGEIGQGHPDPDIGFAEGRFYLINQTKFDYVSPGPWVESIEVRAGVDTTGDGAIDTWTDWKAVKETYDCIDGFSKQIKRIPAELDLSGLPAAEGFGFELRIKDTTSNVSTPILDSVRVSFQ